MGKRGYKHFVPKADKSHKFPNEYNFVLLDTIDKLKEVLEEAGEYIAWDLETTGLSPREDKIVGVALGWDDETGYYVPIRHKVGNIEDPKKALDLIYEELKNAKKTFVYNMRFDYRFMEFANFGEYDIDKHIKNNLLGFMHHHGYDMSEVQWFDVAIPVWLADTNKKMPSLKWAARHFLGWDMQTFEETLGDNINFQYVEPELAVEYAGADALSTFVLAGATLKFYKESKMAGKIDNKVLYPMMKWEDHPLPIDYKYLERILLDAQETKKGLEREIHSMVGYSFNVNSGQQLSEGLERLGLHTGEYTKAGYMRTAKDLIAKLDHPISDKLIEYSELSKMISSYISNMSEYAKKEDGKLRFAYKNTRVPTGRLACGGDKKNEYFAKLNLQSIPKASSEMWYVHEADEKHSDDDEDLIMGYRFSREEKSDVVAEGFDPYLNVRKAFLPENDDFYWVSIDFSSQELRIPANLSKEPVWLEAFNSEEGDPHKATAIKLFGEENYDRDKRKKAKGMNFGQKVG
jgi:DNA polymerase-1